MPFPPLHYYINVKTAGAAWQGYIAVPADNSLCMPDTSNKRAKFNLSLNIE